MIDNGIDFVDLSSGRDRIRESIDGAITKVIDNCNFICGKEVQEFESVLAKHIGAKHVISCANGTDALQLVLMAEGIGPGDAVFVPAFTFISTVEVVVLCGATPVFVDVYEDTYNIDHESFKDAIQVAKSNKLNPRMIIAVDLFGQPADINTVKNIAIQNDIIVLSDAAQSLGAKLDDQFVGTLSEWTTVSFFPSKPLGCYGDGGAVITDNQKKAELVSSLRNHGQGKDKYDNVRIGLNSRLDTIQAAILIEKLKIFDDELQRRNKVAGIYSDELNGVVDTPVLMKGVYSSWAQYTIKVDNREHLREKLSEKYIPTAIYYPMPLNKQKAYRKYPVPEHGVPVAEKLSSLVLSLPMHPYLSKDEQGYIVDQIKQFQA